MLTSGLNWHELRRDIDDLPTHPAVADRIIDVVGNMGGISPRELEEVILHDPVKTSSILRLANSDLFGKKGRIATLGHATALLDLHIIRVTSLHFAFTKVHDSIPGFDYGRYWRQSWAKSIVAQRLASYFPATGSEEARIAGLLADFGQILFAESLGERYRDLLRLAQKSVRPIDEIEQELLGMNHTEATGRSFEEWHFPEFMTSAVRNHRLAEFGDRLSDRAREMAKVLHLAHHLATSVADAAEAKIDVVIMQLVNWTGMTIAQAERIIHPLAEEVGAAHPIYSKTSESIEHLRDRARKALFQVGMSTAHALSASTKQVQEIERQSEELRRQRDRLKEQVTLDPLLGIANRRHFDTRLDEELKRCMRNGQPLSLILFDLDHFKQVNDTYLHQAGDEVLKSVTRIMRKCLRSSDILARYGGEEFGVICPETDQEGAISLAERMRQCLECLEIHHRDQILRMTASFGVATVEEPRDVRGADDIVDVADHHLFQAKREGRNQVKYGLCPDPTRMLRGTPGKMISTD